MRTGLITFCVFALALLHQDFWNWDNANLVFGFLPVGLAYHIGYSIVVAIFWGCVIHFAWPKHIEEWADETDDDAPAGHS
jgi:hypothetical protein